MKVVMFSINPLFPGQVMGGAPKHLQNIARYMGQIGHDVTVLCTRRSDTNEPFWWGERVQVLPLLPFHQPFPGPYAVPAYDLAAIVHDVAEQLQNADRFYMHDGEFLFPYVYRQIPTVISLRDNVYPETLMGGFLFQGDSLILISEYARQYFEQTVGRFFPDFSSRIKVIHNGLDWERFKPTTTDRIRAHIPVNPDEDVVVLHPHRPEETKGIGQTIAVVDLLVHQYGIHNIKTLVPKWLDVGLSDELSKYYRSIEAEIARRGLTENFVFHSWVSQELMPEYYNLGHVTLALGNFVESFGNAVYESLGCGTPTIVTRISSHRELLPEHLVSKVDFNDIETATRLAASIIQNKQRTSEATMDYLHAHYSIQKQLEGYAETILKARCVDEMPYRFVPFTGETRFALPIWCYETGSGFYHDFHATYQPLEQLALLLGAYPDGFTFAEAAQRGIESETVMKWYRDGYVYPK
jgi:glycosyltransferase involved in cell wall biosynthesis